MNPIRLSLALLPVIGLAIGSGSPIAAQETPDSPSPDSAEADRLFTYACNDDRRFQASFLPEQAEVTIGDAPPLTLPQVESASGARYSNGETTLYTKGDEAFMEVGNQRILDGCIAQAPGVAAAEAIETTTTTTTTTTTPANTVEQPLQPAEAQPAATPAADVQPVRGLW